MPQHLLDVADLGRDGILEVLTLADVFSEVADRQIPKVPSLRGRTVATLFFESSTRTRLSFEAAAKALSADTMTFAAASSSMNKGESLRDTVETLAAMGVDAMVVRHPSAGAPWQIANWVDVAIVNAGDGQHAHPTQALLDCYTIRETLGHQRGETPADFAGLRVAIVGDVAHSRVARSNIAALTALGAAVTVVAPSTLLPPAIAEWPVEVVHDLDEVLDKLDVCYLLRLQSERMAEALLPSLREYSQRFALTRQRAARLSPDCLVMHAGPMIRGVEIEAAVAELPQAVVTRQVRNGVAVRMAVLFLLLGQPTQLASVPTVPEAANG